MEKLFENPHRSGFSLTNDLVFYMVYGRDTEESNRALTALLNVVLDRKDDPIVKVRVLNTVDKGQNLGDKGTIMDIKAESDSGELFDVEMQRYGIAMGEPRSVHKKSSKNAYPERTIFYGAKLINSSLAMGKDYDKMKKSIVISFIDGILFREGDRLHTEYQLLETTEHNVLSDKLSIHFLELGKLDPGKDPAEMTPLEQLCAYIRFAGDENREDYVNQLLESGEEAVYMSEYVFRKLTEDDYAREMLERQEKAEHDLATMRKYARESGLEEGREEGRKEGRKAAAIEFALKMKQAGMAPEEIATFTGLDIEEIERL